VVRLDRHHAERLVWACRGNRLGEMAVNARPLVQQFVDGMRRERPAFRGTLLTWRAE
jgi:hypothetical protein